MQVVVDLAQEPAPLDRRLRAERPALDTSSEADLINLHGQGYCGALHGGVQTVMASFNSWTNDALGIPEGKIHGSKYLLTDVLEEKMGFDGLVVSDWNGIGQVAGCTNHRCARALRAGVDIFMVPNDWKQFIASTIDLVSSGEVPMARASTTRSPGSCA